MTLRSVLIIDDSEFDRYMLRQQLLQEKISSHIIEHENGQAAIDYLNTPSSDEHFPPELIFVDANMPVMDGEEFLKHFQNVSSQLPELSNSTVVMFTSSECSESERMEKYGCANGYITKMPNSSEELKEALQPLFPSLH